MVVEGVALPLPGLVDVGGQRATDELLLDPLEDEVDEEATAATAAAAVAAAAKRANDGSTPLRGVPQRDGSCCCCCCGALGEAGGSLLLP